MRRYKVKLYSQSTGETTYGNVCAYTWAEAEVLAEIQYPNFVTHVVNVEID